MGFDHAFILAKIERHGALSRIPEILAAADGIMIARGDLGVEIPMARIATVQKKLMRQANQAGKPVITATQMLESMTGNRRPTRAEATDVANAILDGTDCVMLSGESAMGRYPVDAVRMLADIAAATEPEMPRREARDMLPDGEQRAAAKPPELIGFSVGAVFGQSSPVAVIVDTLSGTSARNVARFRLPTWVLARSRLRSTCRRLQFSYGVQPFLVESDAPDQDPRAAACEVFGHWGLNGNLAIHVEGPSMRNPDAIHRISLFEV
jgi:pyruvate kinase